MNMREYRFRNEPRKLLKTKQLEILCSEESSMMPTPIPPRMNMTSEKSILQNEPKRSFYFQSAQTNATEPDLIRVHSCSFVANKTMFGRTQFRLPTPDSSTPFSLTPSPQLP